MPHQLPSTALRNCTDGTLACSSEWASTVTQGMFWPFALFAFCVALFMATSRLGSNRAFAFSGFTAIVGALWLASLGLMAWWMASAFMLVGIGALVVMINSKT